MMNHPDNATDTIVISADLPLMSAFDSTQIMDALLNATIPDNSWEIIGAYFNNFYIVAARHIVRWSVHTYCTRLTTLNDLTVHLAAIELATLLDDMDEADYKLEAGILRTPTPDIMQRVLDDTCKLLLRFCAPALFPEKSSDPLARQIAEAKKYKDNF